MTAGAMVRSNLLNGPGAVGWDAQDVGNDYLTAEAALLDTGKVWMKAKALRKLVGVVLAVRGGETVEAACSAAYGDIGDCYHDVVSTAVKSARWDS